MDQKGWGCGSYGQAGRKANGSQRLICGGCNGRVAWKCAVMVWPKPVTTKCVAIALDGENSCAVADPWQTSASTKFIGNGRVVVMSKYDNLSTALY